jgi:hypothetical protein
MPSMNEVNQSVWRAVVPGLTYDPGSAIVKKWLALRQAGTPIGVPVTAETRLEDEVPHVAQGFSSGNVLVWLGGDNVEVR